MLEKIIGLSAPFVFVYFLQLLDYSKDNMINTITTNITKNKIKVTGNAQSLINEVTILFYDQVNFFISILISIVAAVTIAFLGNNPNLGLIIVLLLVVLLVYWRFSLSYDNNDISTKVIRDEIKKKLKFIIYLVNSVLLVTTLYTQL